MEKEWASRDDAIGRGVPGDGHVATAQGVDRDGDVDGPAAAVHRHVAQRHDLLGGARRLVVREQHRRSLERSASQKQTRQSTVVSC